MLFSRSLCAFSRLTLECLFVSHLRFNALEIIARIFACISRTQYNKLVHVFIMEYSDQPKPVSSHLTRVRVAFKEKSFKD